MAELLPRVLSTATPTASMATRSVDAKKIFPITFNLWIWFHQNHTKKSNPTTVTALVVFVHFMHVPHECLPWQWRFVTLKFRYCKQTFQDNGKAARVMVKRMINDLWGVSGVWWLSSSVIKSAKISAKCFIRLLKWPPNFLKAAEIFPTLRWTSIATSAYWFPDLISE